MDLSKVYGCLPHDLIVKLVVYGFDNTALALFTDCFYYLLYLQTVFNGQKQVQFLVHILKLVISWKGIPQGSILGPTLFNIVINDLMFFTKETGASSFANDIFIYSCSLNDQEAY